MIFICFFIVYIRTYNSRLYYEYVTYVGNVVSIVYGESGEEISKNVNNYYFKKYYLGGNCPKDIDDNWCKTMVANVYVACLILVVKYLI